jgi:hypothetical protein
MNISAFRETPTWDVESVALFPGAVSRLMLAEIVFRALGLERSASRPSLR